jgi:DNA-binding transcriptional LysR family regulator
MEWYRSFVAVYRAGTVSGAAQARFLTQPAVSQQLAALESSLGLTLFTRTPRRMVPTEQGKELYGHVAQAVDVLEQVPQALRGAGRKARQSVLRLGAPLEYFQEMLIPRLTGLPVHWRVEFAVAASLVDKLARAELDCIVATQQSPASGVEYRKIDSERFLLVGAPKTQVPGARRKTQAGLIALQHWLSDQPWVSYSVDMPIVRRYWQVVFQARPAFQAAVVIPNLHAILGTVEAGWGISVLPEYLCRASLKAGRLKLLWKTQQAVSNDLWVAYRKVDRTNPGIARLVRVLQARQTG